MEHENVYQCIQSINDALILKDKVILERGQFVREAESTIDILENKCAELHADKEMLDTRLSEVQCHYAEVEQEKEELGAINRDLGIDREADKTVIEIHNATIAAKDRTITSLQSKNRGLGAIQESDHAEITRLRKVVDNLHTQVANMITEKREAKPDKQASVHTTRLYWDCNCPMNYINHSYIVRCEICGAHSLDQPDSRLDELGMARLSEINELAERYARSNK